MYVRSGQPLSHSHPSKGATPWKAAGAPELAKMKVVCRARISRLGCPDHEGQGILEGSSGVKVQHFSWRGTRTSVVFLRAGRVKWQLQLRAFWGIGGNISGNPAL